MDDVLIASMTLIDATESLNAVLYRIRYAGLTLNYSKSEFKVPQVNFFGMTISSIGISPRPSTMHDLLNAEEPSNRKRGP